MGSGVAVYNFVHRVAHEQSIYSSLNKGGFPLPRNVLLSYAPQFYVRK